jgi:hypothetical protein
LQAWMVKRGRIDKRIEGAFLLGIAIQLALKRLYTSLWGFLELLR